MSIHITKENAERICLMDINNKNIQGVLHIIFSELNRNINEEELVLCLNKAVPELIVKIYFFSDKDIFIYWSGEQEAMASYLLVILHSQLKIDDVIISHTYYPM